MSFTVRLRSVLAFTVPARGLDMQEVFLTSRCLTQDLLIMLLPPGYGRQGVHVALGAAVRAEVQLLLAQGSCILQESTFQ